MAGQCGACTVRTGIAPKLQLRHAYVYVYRAALARACGAAMPTDAAPLFSNSGSSSRRRVQLIRLRNIAIDGPNSAASIQRLHQQFTRHHRATFSQWPGQFSPQSSVVTIK